jgi:hypothetical protein
MENDFYYRIEKTLNNSNIDWILDCHPLKKEPPISIKYNVLISNLLGITKIALKTIEIVP